MLEKTLESPLDCKEIKPVHPKGNQSWKFIGRTDDEAKTQYFGHLMQRTDSLEKMLMLGKTEARRRRGWQRRTWVWASSRSWWWTGKPGLLQSMGSQRENSERLNWNKQAPYKISTSHPSSQYLTCFCLSFPFFFPSISWVQCPPLVFGLFFLPVFDLFFLPLLPHGPSSWFSVFLLCFLIFSLFVPYNS